MTRGKYIVLEGPEGVGKTTQLLELARRLQAAGLPVRTLREPDSQSDLTARAIRQLTQDPRYPMNTRTEVLLYNAARAQSLEVIRQSIQHGVICLVDRNYLTTLAIQYYGRGDVPDYQTINNIIAFAVGDMEPDLCILLDAPVATLRQRLGSRYSGERFDNLDDAFLERVRAGYLWEAHQRKLPVVFATEDQAVVADEIWKLASTELAVREPSTTPGTSAPTSVKEIIEQRPAPAVEPPAMPVEIQPAPPAEPQLPAGSDNQISFENISILLAMLIQQGRRAEYTEYPSASPTYYMPEQLNPETKKTYGEAMDTIMGLYAMMLQRLTGDLANSMSHAEASRVLKPVLPLGTVTTVGVTASLPILESLLARLASQELPEAQALSDALLAQAGTPGGFKQAAAYQKQTSAQLESFAKKYLPDTHAAVTNKPVSLVDFWPKNELLLVADMLYEKSDLSLDELQTAVGDWPYDRKSELFKTYIGDRTDASQQPGRALEKAHYSWDITCDSLDLQQLQRYQTVDDLTRQALTPRRGYDIPKPIEDAGLADSYEACFETSLRLHSSLKQAGYHAESRYAVLQGHKQRCKLTYNARAAYKILQITAGQPASYQNLVSSMREKLAEVHPVTADSLSFHESPA